MKRIALFVGIMFVVASGLLLHVLPALAQSAGPYELAWTSIDAGGGAMAGGAYSLSSSIGQPEPGATQSGGGYALNGGVVDAGGTGASPPRNLKVYLPLVVR